MKRRAKGKEQDAEPDAFTARLVEILRSAEFRTSMIQRLVAASIDAADGCRVVELAVDRVMEERGPAAGLAGRLVREIEAGCSRYAELRGLPYQTVIGPLIRFWPALMDAARTEGLTEEEGYAVMRDLLRKIPASRWSRAKDLDRELYGALLYGFQAIGLVKGGKA